ncbi:HD-domain/PDEase-like protein [Rhizoclosmatium globosum]|uniref:Phosphodiesterase n=1 Tax=Rhizoclosmatium globosum TaxID=329046 RepID=A0A1Y2AJY9_9FUNG|nr:HD-domain/PDEase-like protein [Rhizoclosmatium globosum]|eukprot:ORY22265.1 HD-domain/PDEase-like protein [Rhizoclosmatium globosum]
MELSSKRRRLPPVIRPNPSISPQSNEATTTPVIATAKQVTSPPQTNRNSINTQQKPIITAMSKHASVASTIASSEHSASFLEPPTPMVGVSNASTPRNLSEVKFGHGGTSPLAKTPTGNSMQSSVQLKSAPAEATSASDDSFEIIRGPIQFEVRRDLLSVWIDDVSLHLVWDYAHFYAAWELSRLFLFRNENTMAPLYLSFIPYTVFHLMLRDAHIIFSLAWFISLMTNNIQIGITTLRRHVIAATLLFIVIYICLILLTSNIFATDNNLPRNRPMLFHPQGSASKTLTATTCQVGYTSNITASEEITYLSGILLLGACFLLLELYIHDYAINLLSRSANAHRIEKQNQELKTKLRAEAGIRKDMNLDLDSPITKVIKSIRAMQEARSLDVDVMESLDYVVQILSSNQLFLPNLDFGAGAVDSDVKTWLTAMIAQNTDSQSLYGAVGLGSLEDSKKGPVITQIPRTMQANDQKIAELLENFGSWNFDLFELERLTNGLPLYTVAMAAFRKHGFIEVYNLDEQVVQSFFKTIESKYRPLPYHSALHAADVLHAMNFFLTSLGLEGSFKQDVSLLDISAAIHDVDHPGVTNAYLVSTGHPLALRYNDIAVLESHHCATAFEIMINNPGCDIFKRLPADKLKTIRQLIVSMVLATDMSNHFEYIAKFKIKVNGLINNNNSGGGGGGGSGGGALDFNSAQDRQLALNISSNVETFRTRPKDWKVFQQGDEEKRSGYPVSMFMDRTTTFIPKCQVGFVDYIVIPLYEALDVFLRAKEYDFEAIRNLETNRDYWKAQQPPS